MRNFHTMNLIVDSIEHPVVTAAQGPKTGQLPGQRLSSSGLGSKPDER
jgi:hypothetical protein